MLQAEPSRALQLLPMTNNNQQVTQRTAPQQAAPQQAAPVLTATLADTATADTGDQSSHKFNMQEGTGSSSSSSSSSNDSSSSDDGSSNDIHRRQQSVYRVDGSLPNSSSRQPSEGFSASLEEQQQLLSSLLKALEVQNNGSYAMLFGFGSAPALDLLGADWGLDCLRQGLDWCNGML
jgi:hypothetical protein